MSKNLTNNDVDPTTGEEDFSFEKHIIDKYVNDSGLANIIMFLDSSFPLLSSTSTFYHKCTFF